MKDENYYQVSGWMVKRLHLKGVELVCYAIIYGFTQDGGGQLFTGSLKYLETWAGASRSTVRRALRNLVVSGLIRKEEKIINDVIFNHYSCFDEGGIIMTGGGVQNDSEGGVKMNPYNNIIDNNIDIYSTPKEKKQADIFPELSKNIKSLFRNSLLNDFKIFEKKFSEPEFQNVDLNYYFNQVRDWSDSSNTKRTAIGWAATARQFMRKDQTSKKLKTLDGQKTDESYLEYLKLGENGNY